MDLILKNKDDKVLLDIEIYNHEYIDCNVTINVVVFADILLKMNDYQQRESFIKSMSYFQTIKQKIYDEVKDESESELIRIANLIKKDMLNAAEKFNLYFNED